LGIAAGVIATVVGGLILQTISRPQKGVTLPNISSSSAGPCGEVEIDETYVGGKRKGRTGRPGAGDLGKKTPVMGMVERGGQVVAMTVESAQASSLMPHMRKRVLPSSTVYTDELGGYKSTEASGYTHRRINHSEGVYVAGDVHTNTIEGFWSLVKSGIRGTHHAVSAKWLQGYLNEYAWRYNHRDEPQAMFLTLLLRSALPLP